VYKHHDLNSPQNQTTRKICLDVKKARQPRKMLKWPKGVKPQYEAILDTGKFARYERDDGVDEHGLQHTAVIQGWIVKPPPGAPVKSRWVIDLEFGNCLCKDDSLEDSQNENWSSGASSGDESESHTSDHDDDDDDDESDDESDDDQEPLPQFVPSGFKRAKVSLAFIKDFVPLSQEIRDQLKRAGAVKAGTVVHKSARPFYLTKKELLEIPPGRNVAVYVFDRNWGDHALEANERGKKVSFKKFFESVRGTMSRNKAGDKLTLTWGGDPEPYTLDTEIMYAKDSWYPMTDGVLPAGDKFGKVLGKAILWKDIAPHTNVGFRGPIMLAKYANKMPKWVYREW
jgi:hypothetical protein